MLFTDVWHRHRLLQAKSHIQYTINGSRDLLVSNGESDKRRSTVRHPVTRKTNNAPGQIVILEFTLIRGQCGAATIAWAGKRVSVVNERCVSDFFVVQVRRRRIDLLSARTAYFKSKQLLLVAFSVHHVHANTNGSNCWLGIYTVNVVCICCASGTCKWKQQ